MSFLFRSKTEVNTRAFSHKGYHSASVSRFITVGAPSRHPHPLPPMLLGAQPLPAGAAGDRRGQAGLKLLQRGRGWRLLARKVEINPGSTSIRRGAATMTASSTGQCHTVTAPKKTAICSGSMNPNKSSPTATGIAQTTPMTAARPSTAIQTRSRPNAASVASPTMRMKIPITAV